MRATKIANLQLLLIFADQNVVQLDVSMNNIAFAHQLESQQDLLRVPSHSADVETLAAAILFEYLS
jgi:hypothetical protein